MIARTLYSGPAINVLAIILTARVLGLEMGVARAVGAIVFSVVIGLIMHLIYRKEELSRAAGQTAAPQPEVSRPLWQNLIYFALMIGVLVFANWGEPKTNSRLWQAVYSAKWLITGGLSAAFAVTLVRWFGVRWWKVLLAAVPSAALALLFPRHPVISFAAGVVGLSALAATTPGETRDWFESTWGFAKQIAPLLFFGVLIAGALLGRPGHEGLIPSSWVTAAVGGNSPQSNFLASIAGAFMYFATLTEVPILQGLIGSGMGKGPALALLLAGPALSLPSMLVIRSILCTQKTIVYVSLVVAMATICGFVFGWLF